MWTIDPIDYKYKNMNVANVVGSARRWCLAYVMRCWKWMSPGPRAMVGEAWEESGRILWNFWKRPGANPDKIWFFFETAGSYGKLEWSAHFSIAGRFLPVGCHSKTVGHLSITPWQIRTPDTTLTYQLLTYLNLHLYYLISNILNYW